MTLGNFKDRLQLLDMSKMVLGFIPDLGNLLTEVLIKHLVQNVPGYSKSKAILAIKYYKRTVEKKFWELVFESVQRYADTGVEMYILGNPTPKRVFVRFLYSLGDDPAQHQFAGVKTGDASCIRCTYNQKIHGYFNREERTLRDPHHVKALLEYATSGFNKYLRGRPKNDREKESLDEMKSLGLQIEGNSTFNGVLMGSFGDGRSNHVYRSPPDIMHTWDAGILKNCVKWSLCIVDRLAVVDSDFKFSIALLDNRVASFKVRHHY